MILIRVPFLPQANPPFPHLSSRFIRDGESVATLMDLGKQLLGRRQVVQRVLVTRFQAGSVIPTTIVLYYDYIMTTL